MISLTHDDARAVRLPQRLLDDVHEPEDTFAILLEDCVPVRGDVFRVAYEPVAFAHESQCIPPEHHVQAHHDRAGLGEVRELLHRLYDALAHLRR